MNFHESFFKTFSHKTDIQTPYSSLLVLAGARYHHAFRNNALEVSFCFLLHLTWTGYTWIQQYFPKVHCVLSKKNKEGSLRKLVTVFPPNSFIFLWQFVTKFVLLGLLLKSVVSKHLRRNLLDSAQTWNFNGCISQLQD